MTKKQTYELWNYLQQSIKEYEELYEEYGDKVYLDLIEELNAIQMKMVQILGSVPSDV